MSMYLRNSKRNAFTFFYLGNNAKAANCKKGDIKQNIVKNE